MKDTTSKTEEHEGPGRSDRALPRARGQETGPPYRLATLRVAFGKTQMQVAERARMGHAARERAVGEYSYDGLVARLSPIARGDLSGAEQLSR